MYPRIAAVVCCCLANAALADHDHPIAPEAQLVIGRLLAPPILSAAPGFDVDVRVFPGQLYDPLQLTPDGDRLLVNDIGGETATGGSRIYALNGFGRLAVVVGLGKTLPVTGFDIAPPGFGAFAGQMLALTQPATSMAGLNAPHLVQSITPEGSSRICTLPLHGMTNGGIPGIGVEARFGPANSGFAGRLFLVTFGNNTIYQITPDETCAPFVDFDSQEFSGPSGIAFSPDGSEMLVSVARGSDFDPSSHVEGAILRVDANGRISPTPYATGFRRPTGMAFAPPQFGSYAGQLFVTDTGNPQVPVPMTRALDRDGRIMRVAANHETKIVAEGFVNPGGLFFANETLWITDMNGNFIGGRRELPDGFIAAITLERHRW